MSFIPTNWDYSPTMTDVLAFLSVRGWSKIEHPNPNFTVFKSPGPEGSTLAINKHGEYFGENLNMYIDSLMYFYDFKSRTQAVVEIAKSTNDLIFKKISSSKISTIPLEIAANAIAYSSSAIKKIAKIEAYRQIYDNEKSSSIKDVTKKISLGHTFHGSFGISIISPLPISFDETLFENKKRSDFLKPPIQRKIFERYANTVRMSALAVENKSIDPLIVDVENGPDSGICGDFASFWKNRMDYEIEFAPAWSDQFNINGNFNADYVMTPESVEYLKKAETILKKEEIPARTPITGKISDLHRDVEVEEGPRKHYITICWDGSGKRVKLALGADDYKKAIFAHDKDYQVLAIGYLKRGAPYYRLTNIEKFEVL